jgi:hypothetical protein
MLTEQDCPVHGVVDYGLRYVEANAGRAGSREELLAEIGRGPDGES